MLIVRDRVLIRNRNMLLLYDLTKGIPEDIASHQFHLAGVLDHFATLRDVLGRVRLEIRGQEDDVVAADVPEAGVQRFR